jgi:hypothetical protein
LLVAGRRAALQGRLVVLRVKKPYFAISAAFAVLLTGAAISVAAQQAFTGRISDSACGPSHAARASSVSQSDRQCLLACINALARYVLVDESGRVLTIANQDAIGLPLYAGRPVKIAGDRNGDAITIAKVEAIAAHLHLGHVMTNWRDTPGGRGFLPVALDQARAAALHAGLAVKGASLDDIRAQAREVVRALDPTTESGAADATYGVRKAIAGAVQHLELAARAEGATPNLTARAADVSSALDDSLRWTDEAVAAAQRVRAANDRDEAAAGARDLAALTARISDDGLARAQSQMNLILKGENLLGAPR